MSNYLTQAIILSLKETWDMMFEENIEAISHILQPQTPMVSSVIQFNGAFDGHLTVGVDSALVTQLAVKFYMMEEDELDEECTFGLVNEFSNIVAGNVKSHFPEPNQISLPIACESNFETLSQTTSKQQLVQLFSTRERQVLIKITH